jgi:hypothetical protein
MSFGHSDKLSKKGRKRPTIILTNFRKKMERRKMSHRQSDMFSKRRKMSHSHSDKFSKKGRKCPLVIQTSFQKRRTVSIGHSDHHPEMGGFCPYCHSDPFSDLGGKFS